MDWVEAARNNDILFLNYTTSAWAFAIMGTMARKFNRKIVLDMDDALLHVRSDNSSFAHYQKSEDPESAYRIVRSIAKEVDYITTTSMYLKHVIMRDMDVHPEKIVVLPNFIDLENLYTHRSPPKDDGMITISHFGSSSHFKDLQGEEFIAGLDMLMKDLPNVNFFTIGSLMPRLKAKWGQRYSYGFGDVDIYKWVKEKMPGFMDNTDIVVAPLDVDIYNKSKSYIKFLEYSSCVKPGVYQDIYPYQEIVVHEKNGFLATTRQDWFKYLKLLATDKNVRSRVAGEAFKAIQGHTIQANVSRYVDFFKKIV
jgi:glycosyltransferase involved in cell wall biosynthesis